MSLLQTWWPFFGSQTRVEGRTLFDQGQVESLIAQGERRQAQVRDNGDRHTVTFERQGPAQSLNCTCDVAEAGGYCPHMWAALSSWHTTPQAEETLAGAPKPPKARKRGELTPTRIAEPRQPRWVGRLALLHPGHEATLLPSDPLEAVTPGVRQLCYIVCVEASARTGRLVIEAQQRSPTRRGQAAPRPVRLTAELADELADPADRELAAQLLGARRMDDENSQPERGDRASQRFALLPGVWRSMLRRMIDTGRCYVDRVDEQRPLTWDASSSDRPWVLWVVGNEDGHGLTVEAELRREVDGSPQAMSIAQPDLILGGRDGLLIDLDQAAAFDDRDAWRWVSQFRDDLSRLGEATPIKVPRDEVDAFLEQLYLLPQLPEVDLPLAFARPEQRVPPQPMIEVFRPRLGQDRATHTARVGFLYGSTRVGVNQPGRFVSLGAPTEGDEPTHAQLVRRDARAERQALQLLVNLGFTGGLADGGTVLTLPTRLLAEAIDQLLAAGWVVRVEDKPIRRASTPRLTITSGVNWFELTGSVDFDRADGGVDRVALPDILAAAKRGEAMIQLGDGSQGLLPQQWLDDHALLTTLGKSRGDKLRYSAASAHLLDAILDDQTRAQLQADEQYQQLRDRLKAFSGVEPRDASPGFHGELRPYQRQGLGWLMFLRDFGMNGVLADDMGLGKTVQVLALLQAQYATGTHPPSLIVAPRSVLFNWIDEAQRFAPDLRVALYAGPLRQELLAQPDRFNVLLTSYGLLRRDIDLLKPLTFHSVVLDEAQAIKNPGSQSAEAARSLNAPHRLALTGTPVENHLGDLWSIFEFLNPGMLGTDSGFTAMVKGGLDDPRSRAAATRAAAALRPFILRRTKAAVLDDLPPRSEQTIVCEMEPAQRQVYDELLVYYRNTLLGPTAPTQAGGSPMQVLEALLRLRQAACHPGLIDPTRRSEPSAKLDSLLEQLTELIAEGHKALVFSQFTSMLSIVRERLDAAGLAYAYLDGQTRDRKAVVHRFQRDPSVSIFLISLKAGGLGLNLTAADYVFILDPWWNPAVEQQAIDRAHRIGQQRHVFAYRLICQDTVEQRIAELQQRKRDLADAIVGGSQSVAANLTREDLELLLS